MRLGPNTIEITPETRWTNNPNHPHNVHLYDITNCESCGAVIQAPNAFQASWNPEVFSRIPELPELPPEGYYHEGREKEACDLCYNDPAFD